jgi:hypothetical protein
VLNVISTGLRKAVADEDNEGALQWCLSLMRWGGVFPHNGDWLINNMGNLSELLGDNRRLFLGANIDPENDINPGIRFNSGMTKVYSLLVDNFIIYDSRVAAALGWIIAKFCIDTNKSLVPDVLRFPYAPAKEADNVAKPKIRNPGCGDLVFPRLYSGRKHAKANLYASWLLGKVLDISGTKIFQNLRELEAALFMIGYDLEGHNVVNMINNSDEENADDNCSDDKPFNLETRGGDGKRKAFKYNISENKLTIINENNRKDVFIFDEIYSILKYLYDEFGMNCFPLANNVEKLGNNEEAPGSGMAILNQQPGNIKHAQAASYLGRIFEDVGIAEWNHKSRGIKWRLVNNVPSADELKSILAQVEDS